jgi:hypothetical protein
VVLACPGAAAAARTVHVQNASELTAAVAAAQPGDEIVLAAGTYALSGLSCTADGSEAAPIVVRSATPLAARVEFDGLEGFKVSGAHWHFEGLEVVGVCASDPDCEHAFHVTGRADGFVLRGSRVMDFNAQLKVNASMIGGTWEVPDRGLVEGCELHDTTPRDTSNPVTKLNIDTGDDWVVRGNVIRDFRKNGGDDVSYGVFLKSGGKRGVIEKNLIVCDSGAGGGVRIGMSFGGGGTAPQYCAPAFDPNVACDPEHEDGIMRNNVVVSCSDVGVYLNKAKGSNVLYNTLIGTAGVDFRFTSSTGEAVGNVLTGVIRNRDGASGTFADNLAGVSLATFQAMYMDPLGADLRQKGDLGQLIAQGPMRAEVGDDYCGRARPAGAYTLGALEHSLGDCDTTTPPPGGDGGVSGAPDGGAGPGADGGGGGAGDGDAGCGCRSGGRGRASSWGGGLALLAGAGAGAALARGRRRRGRRIVLASLVVALALVGCGGGGAGNASGDTMAEKARPRPVRKAGAPDTVPVEPLEVKVTPRRTGGALEIAIVVVGRGHQEGEPFENPDGWELEVHDHNGRALRRLMNGPKKVMREPVGREDGTQWNVTVKHSIFFELPEAVEKVRVVVRVPGAKPYEVMAAVPPGEGA